MTDSAKVAVMAHDIRRLVLKMCAARGQGYVGQGLELADIVACLFHSEMRKNPDGSYLDRFVLSTGHSAVVLFAALHQVGVYTEEEILEYGKDGSVIEEAPLEDMPGFEVSGGSLGQGPSQAVGLALGLTMLGEPARVFCELSDGELQEGSVWEAFMAAGSRGLSNLVFLIDNNGEQADGATTEILDVEPVVAKLEAFGIAAHRVDGHNIPALLSAFDSARECTSGPTALICDTVPGKGSASLEKYEKVHYVRARPELWQRATEDLIRASPARQGP